MVTSTGSQSVIVQPGGYARLDIYEVHDGNVAEDLGNNPMDSLHRATIDFEIHNKSSKNHYPDHVSCVFRYLGMMTNPDASGSNCYGSDNDDTKGGTYEVGDVSYHGTPSSYEGGQ